MRTLTLEEAGPRPRSLAVGTFDGVHIGHREVIGSSDTVLTFEPHPQAVLAPAFTPRLLTPLPIKSDLVASLGVEELVIVHFDAEFAAVTAEHFIDEIIISRIGATSVSIGENFRFGAHARGDGALLEADGRLDVRVVPLRELEGEVVSSSRIRSLIAAGEVARVTRLLGAPFELRGIVVPGDRRGRELGFPTANLIPQEGLVCPGHGVYAGFANGWPTAVSIGVRPTFGTGRAELIEAHLIDFDGDLYGQELRLHFIERLRGERRFATVEELIDVMHEDVDRARAICGSAG
jgi:riboflavin kinase / FMN adenylyltransferase